MVEVHFSFHGFFQRCLLSALEAFIHGLSMSWWFALYEIQEGLDTRPLYCSVQADGCVFRRSRLPFEEPLVGALDVLDFWRSFFICDYSFHYLFLRLWLLPSPIEISRPKDLALKGGQLPQACNTLAHRG